MANNLSTKFFFVGGAKKVAKPLWWILLIIIVFWAPFLRVWWWVFVPLILSIQLKNLYFWWLRWDFAYPKEKWVILEITPPKEVLIPFKAMEDVFAVMWPTVYDRANFRELWCEGMLDNAPNWMSWELVCIEGKIHFYARVLQQHRSVLESVLYSYYPEIEIQEVQDYVKNVPSDIPNEEWNLYGEDFVLNKPAAYPIKTFEEFFEPQGEKISAEEKRIDPMLSLLESMSKLGTGEQYWLQYIASSIMDFDDPWKTEAEKIIAKISRRPVKKEKSIIEELLEIAHELIFGPQKEGSGDKVKYTWAKQQKTEEGESVEMLLTPGERDILSKIENKIKKAAFRMTIRGVYVAKRENWKEIHKVLARAHVAHFSTQNLNYLQFSLLTRTKVHYLIRKRRVYLRARRLFRNYALRFPPLFPDRKSICAILNTEEVASLFHFPVKISGMVAPTAPRVEFKKAGPPPNLPVE